jgi:uncharacterized protein
MHVLDSVYGPSRIDEPVLVDLIQSAALQRLQGVLQHGISGLIGVTRPTTRLEHTLGVMILVRRLGGDLSSQIGALLHDVSHTAFSHVIDYVFDGHDSQDYHEEMKEVYLEGSDIPAVLARHGYNWRDFLDESRFTLLEQPAPALCADRLDYFLRDSLDLGLSDPDQVALTLAHLKEHQGRVVVGSLPVAQWLGYTYIAADEASWANFHEVGLYELAARAIRRGLDSGVLEEADIWGSDEAAWRKLHTGSDPDLQALLALVSPNTRFVWDSDHPDFRVSTKLRTIDPDVLQDGRVARLSELDPSFATFRADYLRRKQGKWPMRVVPA